MQNSASAAAVSTRWQDELTELSRTYGFQRPVYDVYSDRRGGRTAWSASVRVESYTAAARLWYDGPYVNNAREEAAETLVKHIKHAHRYNERELEREAVESTSQNGEAEAEGARTVQAMNSVGRSRVGRGGRRMEVSI